jgi:hypothetical protein
VAQFKITITDTHEGVKVESTPPAGELLKAIRNGHYKPTKAESLACAFFVDCLKAGLPNSGLVKRAPRGLIL